MTKHGANIITHPWTLLLSSSSVAASIILALNATTNLSIIDGKYGTKKDWDTKAILCGVCKEELTIKEYMNSNNHCPRCHAPFNPGCSKHYHLYFEK